MKSLYASILALPLLLSLQGCTPERIKENQVCAETSRLCSARCENTYQRCLDDSPRIDPANPQPIPNCAGALQVCKQECKKDQVACLSS